MRRRSITLFACIALIASLTRSTGALLHSLSPEYVYLRTENATHFGRFNPWAAAFGYRLCFSQDTGEATSTVLSSDRRNTCKYTVGVHYFLGHIDSRLETHSETILAHIHFKQIDDRGAFDVRSIQAANGHIWADGLWAHCWDLYVCVTREPQWGDLANTCTYVNLFRRSVIFQGQGPLQYEHRSDIVREFASFLTPGIVYDPAWVERFQNRGGQVMMARFGDLFDEEGCDGRDEDEDDGDDGVDDRGERVVEKEPRNLMNNNNDPRGARRRGPGPRGGQRRPHGAHVGRPRSAKRLRRRGAPRSARRRSPGPCGERRRLHGAHAGRHRRARRLLRKDTRGARRRSQVLAANGDVSKSKSC